MLVLEMEATKNSQKILNQPGRLNDSLVDFLKAGDLVIDDCTYFDENFCPLGSLFHSRFRAHLAG